MKSTMKLRVPTRTSEEEPSNTDKQNYQSCSSVSEANDTKKQILKHLKPIKTCWN